MSITRTITSQRTIPAAAEIATVIGKPDRPPCADGPSNWDLDVGSPDTWNAAVQICRGCPLLSACEQLALGYIERGAAPRAMIWAGVGYDSSGKVIEDLSRHRIASIDHKRPLRIIRTGANPAPVEPAQSAPRRHLVLGRPLRPTGTE